MKKILNIIIISFFILACKNQDSSKDHKPTNDTTTKSESIKSVQVSNHEDPVCSMNVDKNVADSANYNGQILGFCSSECKSEFLKNPTAYTKNIK